MKVLWVFAHPDQASLNARLRDEGLAALDREGHEYRVSDLYSMGWKPVVDNADFGARDGAGRLHVPGASERAYRHGALSQDIRAEQDKLVWADALVVQFPLWWFGMPAILKGWFDRVFVKGFAYGVKHPETGRTLRYGNGGLAGKRAMVVVTVGAPEESLGPRGIHGGMEDLLFPLQHGTLWYSGMTVVPPVVIGGADRLSAEGYRHAAEQLRERVCGLPVSTPIPFRHQDGGDYDGDLVLRPELAAGATGVRAHYSRCG